MSSDKIPVLGGKSSLESSQDVSHIIQASFHDTALHELESELVSNILAAKGSRDVIQESYVETLEAVKTEYTQHLTTIGELERHIMQAQTRVVSAKEKDMLSRALSAGLYESKIRASLRDCLDPELLMNNKLLSPNDFFQHPSSVSSAPKAANKPNYLKSLVRGDNGKDSPRNVLIAWEDEGVEIDDHTLLEETSVVKQAFHGEKRKVTSSEVGKPRTAEFWKDHTNVEKRNAERNHLDLLVRMTEGKKNPRFIKSSEAGKTKSLVKVYPPGHRPDSSTKLPPIFIATPKFILFSSYEPGKVYEATVELRNVSAVLQNCRVIPPITGFFGINLGEFPSESSLIAPGMACVFKVRFLPDALCEFEDKLTVHIPDRPSLSIPLIGKRPTPILTISESIDVGECLVAATKISSIKLKNDGGEGKFCILPKSAWPCASFKQAIGIGVSSQRSLPIGEGFSIFPGTFRLKAKEDLTLQILFNPSDIGDHQAEFVMVCDNCQVRFFSVQGQGTRLQFEISHVDGGLYMPQATDYVDAFSTSHIAFPPLNLGMAFDKRISVRNSRHIDIPFAWAIVKPHLTAPIPPLQLEISFAESESARVLGAAVDSQEVKLPDCRIIEDQSAFSIEPHNGMFRAGETLEFTLSFLPDKNAEFHSVLHLIIPSVPQLSSAGESDSSQRLPSGRSESSGVSSAGSESRSRSAKSAQSVNVADVTALEIDLRGNCQPYQLSLSPCAIFLDGETLVRTSSRHSFTMKNESQGPAAFEWQPIADDDAIIEVEPKIGVLEPGAIAVLTAIVTGTRAGRTTKQIPCWVEFCPVALCLQFEATFKGPECVFKSVGQSSRQQLTYMDFGLIRLNEISKLRFEIANFSGINAEWKLAFLPPFEDSDEDKRMEPIKQEEISFSVDQGDISPLSSQSIELTMKPASNILGARTGFLKLEVASGKTKVVQFFADVQKPDICLLSSELTFQGDIFVDTVARETIYLINKTSLSTEYQWEIDEIRYSEASICRSCTIDIEASQGVIGPKERLPLFIAINPHEMGYLEAFISCICPEIESRLVLLIRAQSKGLKIDYSIFENPEDSEINFGSFNLGQVVRRQLIIKNLTMIPSNFSLTLVKFQPPKQPQMSASDHESAIRRKLMSSDVKSVAEVKSELLKNELGVCFVAIPSSGHLTAEGSAVVEVFAVADMWGKYNDQIVSQVGDLPPEVIAIKAESVGSPLLFQMMIAQRQKTAMCRFGVAVQGTTPITKKLRLLNEGPCDIRLDWRLFDTNQGRNKKFVDFLHYVIDPFPDKNKPRDQAITSNLVSCILKKHEGTPSELRGIFSVSPEQLVVKGRSHATIEVTLDPRQVISLENDQKFINIEAFGRAFASLEENIRLPSDGSVERIQWYDANSLNLSITAQIQPAVLTMETVDEDQLSLSLPASSLASRPSFKGAPVTLRFFNYHETELKLTAEILSPFKIVHFSTALRSNLIDKPTNKTGEIVLPAHDTLIVKINVESSSSMLSDLNSLVPNLAMVEGRFMTLKSTDLSRSVHFRRFFTIRFSNQVTQNVRLSCSIPLPSLEISKQLLEFPKTMVGRTRELWFNAINHSDSDTWIECHIETESDYDRGCFRVKPITSRVGPSDGRRISIDVTFSPKHEGIHTARVVVKGKILGERFEVQLRGDGSYDEKYAL